MRYLVLMIFAMFLGCDDGASSTGQPAPANAAAAPAGMSKYAYLAADGGPHMLLPSGVAGVDYGKACAATASVQMALMPVGSASAMIFADPPMTAWGTSVDGLVEIYYLKSWSGTNLDALIDKATAALSTVSMADSG